MFRSPLCTIIGNSWRRDGEFLYFRENTTKFRLISVHHGKNYFSAIIYHRLKL